ncbi:MAG: porin family protein [Rickettsiales bacterium]|nr:porin family protein [Rickettsiales bacterium]
MPTRNPPKNPELLLWLAWLCFWSRQATADVILTLPDGLETRQLNEDRPRKLMNVYRNTDQIANQYRGELKYRPDSNGVVYYRKGRYYVSAYFFLKNFSLEKIENNGNGESKIKTGKQKNSYSATFGYYFTRSFSMEFEYFDYSDSLGAPTLVGQQSVDSGIAETKNYILNFMVEVNQSRIIPFFAAGFGIAKSNFRHVGTSLEDLDLNIDSEFTPLYQFMAGFEFALTDQLLLGVRYRLYDSFVDLKSKDGYIFKYSPRNNFNIGFRYVL